MGFRIVSGARDRLLRRGKYRNTPAAALVHFNQHSGFGGAMPHHPLLLGLPTELSIEILGRLEQQDLASAVCSCRALASLRELAWRSACFRRWPKWSAIACEPGAQWRRQYELLTLREAEAGTVCPVAVVRQTQQVVTERHRSILTEWLCEVRGAVGGWGRRCMTPITCRHPQPSPPPLPQVSFDWQLESTILFKAVAYLDHYLSTLAVEQLGRWVGAPTFTCPSRPAQPACAPNPAQDRRISPN